MKYSEICQKVKDGSLKIIDNGHGTGLVKHNLEQRFKFYTERGAWQLHDEIGIGELIGYDVHQCQYCQEYVYMVLLEDSVYLLHADKWQDLSKASGDRWNYRFKPEENTDVCKAKELTKAKKLTSIIEVETGNLVFQNYFETEVLYDLPDKYSYPNINSILGRQRLMTYLATQNVGYGQMGNMSVTVYSNEKDQIIIGQDIEDYDEALEYENYVDELTKKEIKYYQSQIKKYNKFRKVLDKGNFKKLGSLSLSVWRWMCADKSVLDKHNEPLNSEPNGRYSDTLMAKLTPGRYKIEHFYDFKETEIYSTIKKV